MSKVKEVHPLHGQVGGPPTGNPGWYKGDGGQWRLDPVRKMSWDREGIHFLLGLFVWSLPFACLPFGDIFGLWALTAIVATVATVLFIVYEISEGWRIYDWAYRDVGGYLVGALLTPVIWGLLFLFTPLTVRGL